MSPARSRSDAFPHTMEHLDDEALRQHPLGHRVAPRYLIQVSMGPFAPRPSHITEHALTSLLIH